MKTTHPPTSKDKKTPITIQILFFFELSGFVEVVVFEVEVVVFEVEEDGVEKGRGIVQKTVEWSEGAVEESEAFPAVKQERGLVEGKTYILSIRDWRAHERKVKPGREGYNFGQISLMFPLWPSIVAFPIIKSPGWVKESKELKSPVQNQSNERKIGKPTRMGRGKSLIIFQVSTAFLSWQPWS